MGLLDTKSFGFYSQEDKEKAMKALSDFLRPEFMSRVDEIVVFNPLTKENYAEIAGLMLSEMKEPLAEKGITLKFDKRVLNLIAEKSFGKKFGARDIRSVIRSDIEDKIADVIVENAGKEPAVIKLSAKKDAIEVNAE